MSIEVDDSADNMTLMVWRKIARTTTSARTADELTGWIMQLLKDYEWGPTHNLVAEHDALTKIPPHISYLDN